MEKEINVFKQGKQLSVIGRGRGLQGGGFMNEGLGGGPGNYKDLSGVYSPNGLCKLRN